MQIRKETGVLSPPYGPIFSGLKGMWGGMPPTPGRPEAGVTGGVSPAVRG